MLSSAITPLFVSGTKSFSTVDRIQSYRARWIIPVAGPPVANGVLVVHGERIVGIHRTPRPDTIDLGDVAVLPGLVNCHTHLEFSRLNQPLEPMSPFTDWIRSVVGYRREMSDDVSKAIREGSQESLQGGVTLLGEIATTGWNWVDYRSGPDCVVFQELLGTTESRVAQMSESAKTHLSAPQTEQLSSGLSPHAPYSVAPELFRAALELAKTFDCPVAMHLAETEAERELLVKGTGEFREMLQEFGVWRPELFGGKTWGEFLEPLSELAHPLVIHGNYLSDSELRFLAQHPHMTLVYCPRTHAAFGHPPHPWRTLLNLEGSVALGTDSRASNPDLRLWAELQFLAANFPEVSHLELIRLATLSGARALGKSRDQGTLAAGKLANLVVIGPVPPSGPALPSQLITEECLVRGVMLRGEWIVKSSG